MTLEERVEALELLIANMATHQQDTESATCAANKAIADALLPGGVLHAARKQAAIDKNVDFILQNALSVHYQSCE